jgi:magnesium-transporting ATPase (P-type)
VVAAKVFGFFFFQRTNTTLVGSIGVVGGVVESGWKGVFPGSVRLRANAHTRARARAYTHTCKHTLCTNNAQTTPFPPPPSQKLRESLPEGVQEAEYEVLNILEFNSTRKRMSVVLRCPDNRLVLYCKARGCQCLLCPGLGWVHRCQSIPPTTIFQASGTRLLAPWLTPPCPAAPAQGADTVIYERMARGHPTNDALRDVTLQHMEDYGSAGLRTLCLSYRELDAQFYDT